MSAKIDFLINKNDNFEIIRDEITAIIAAEQANQKKLSASSPITDETYFNFKIFSERLDPVNSLASDGEIDEDNFPFINVWYNNSSLQSNSQTNGIQKYQSDYNIDIYAVSKSKIDESGNVTNSDELSSKRVQRIVKIIRNILANQNYTQLNLPKVVSGRFIQNISMLPPDAERSLNNMSVARITLQVDHIETTGENQYNNVELIQAKCTQDKNGLITYFDIKIIEEE